MSGQRGIRAIGARNVLVEFLGAFVRKLDGWFPVAPVVAMLSPNPSEESNVRMAISRLKARGWLVPERRGAVKGYALSASAREALAVGDGVIYADPQPADLADGWALVAFSIPEQQRSKRHALKARLADVGFGSSGPGLLLAPARLLSDARRIVADLDVNEFVELYTAHHQGQDPVALVKRSWDLEALRARYDRFLTLAEAILDRWRDSPLTATEAVLEDYLLALHEWRLVRYADPALPMALLGPEWPGPHARAAFVHIVELLDAPAFEYVAGHMPR